MGQNTERRRTGSRPICFSVDIDDRTAPSPGGGVVSLTGTRDPPCALGWTVSSLHPQTGVLILRTSGGGFDNGATADATREDGVILE